MAFNATVKPKPTKGLVVDGSCCPNPGNVEWRGVDLETGKEVFRSKSYPMGTNNIAEFLAIIHGLASTSETLLDIYSDSFVARGWIKEGLCRGEVQDPELRNVIERGLKFLAKFPGAHRRVFTWETKLWGENPADFGRKR